MMEVEQKNREEENVGSPRRVYRWMKILGLLVLAVFLTFCALFVTGKVLTRNLEPETDPRAFAPWGPETSFLSTRSGDVHILDIGEGDAILLVHGSGGSIADWQEGAAERLAASNRVVAFDTYGFGLSDRNHLFEYGNALWARQAIDVLDALEIERAVVLGHSAGAIVAAILAADHPERFRGVVLTGHGFEMDPAQMVPALPGIGELSALDLNNLVLETYSDSHREKVDAAYRIRGTRDAFLTFIRRQYTVDGLRLLGGTYEDIEIPVLQLHGSLDQSQDINSAQMLSSRMADTRFVTIEGSGHHVHIEAPDQWAEEVAKFAASLPP
jgi:pimeloyl-ACP methyl ester carboxylesterase